MRMLKFGDVGDDVRQVQKDINQYYDDPAFQNAFKTELLKAKLYPAAMKRLDPDGKFGPLTKAAVTAFQVYKGLKDIDGIAGPETLTALYPYSVYQIRVTVDRRGSQRAVPQSAVPDRQSDRDDNQTVPLQIAQKYQLKLQPFLDLNSQLPAPILPPLTLPPLSPGAQKRSAVAQLKAGVTHSIPVTGSSLKPYDVLSLDFVGVVLTASAVNQGLDFGWGLPLSSGASGTASLSWALAWWPRRFHWRQFDFLGFSAKAGVGLGAKAKSPLQPFLSQSLGLSARWRALNDGDRTLDIVLQGTASEKETISIGPTSVSASTALTGFVGIQFSAF